MLDVLLSFEMLLKEAPAGLVLPKEILSELLLGCKTLYVSNTLA